MNLPRMYGIKGRMNGHSLIVENFDFKIFISIKSNCKIPGLTVTNYIEFKIDQVKLSSFLKIVSFSIAYMGFKFNGNIEQEVMIRNNFFFL